MFLNNRGDVNQIFVFIMAIIVAGLVILYGVRFIQDYLGKQDDVLLTDFVNQVEVSVKGTSFGSVDLAKLKLPSKYDQVCFVDYEATASQVGPGVNPKILSDVQTRGGVLGAEFSNTMFLVDTLGTPNQADDVLFSKPVGKVKVGDMKWNCVAVNNGRVNLRFEGVRGGVLVSEDVS